jgi:uncharacterized protein DUF4406/uncharacterized protein DUF6378
MTYKRSEYSDESAVYVSESAKYGCKNDPCPFTHDSGYVNSAYGVNHTPLIKQIVYISGPMRGYPECNYEAFHDAHGILAQQGYTVLNPAENFDGAKDLPIETYMREDLSMLLGATDIYMLKGWHNSEGARLELAVAKSLGLTVIYEDDDSEPVELEAARIVRNGAREQIYGHPRADFARTGTFWGVEPQDVALRMVQLKISRLMSTPNHRDSVVDAIGYLICYARIMLEEIPE